MSEHGAEAHLRAIRRLMERATIYRAISAPTALVGGCLSLGTAAAELYLQTRAGHAFHADAFGFYRTWTLVFLLTLGANMLFIWQGAHLRGEPLFSPGMKLALRSVAPSFLAGAALSYAVTLTSGLALLPVLFWLVFYGLGLLATMNFAPRSIVVLGWAFLLTGLAVFFYLMDETLVPDMGLPMPAARWPAALMGATFGGYHLIYALCAWPWRSRRLDAIERRPLVAHDDPNDLP